MDLTVLMSIFSALAQIAQFLVKYGPELLTDAEAIFADLELAWQAATSGVALTPDQQTQIDTALDKANTQLQAAVQARADAEAQAALTAAAETPAEGQAVS